MTARTISTAAFTSGDTPLTTSLAAEDTTGNLRYVGNAVSGQSTNDQVPGAQITLPAADMKYTVTLPATGRLKEVYADYVVTAAEEFTRQAQLYVKLYTAPGGSLTFNYLPGSEFALTPAIGGSVPAGTVLTGSVVLDAPVNAGEKMLAIVYLGSDDTGDEESLSGIVSLSTVVEV